MINTGHADLLRVRGEVGQKVRWAEAEAVWSSTFQRKALCVSLLAVELKHCGWIRIDYTDLYRIDYAPTLRQGCIDIVLHSSTK